MARPSDSYWQPGAGGGTPLITGLQDRENLVKTYAEEVATAAAAAVRPATLVTFEQAGSLTVATGRGRVRFPVAVTVLSVAATVDTAPTGAAVLADVNKNGTTIFSTQGNRPSIAASANASSDAVPDVTAFAAGDYMTVDVDQVGSTVAGSDLTVIVRYRET